MTPSIENGRCMVVISGQIARRALALFPAVCLQFGGKAYIVYRVIWKITLFGLAVKRVTWVNVQRCQPGTKEIVRYGILESGNF